MAIANLSLNAFSGDGYEYLSEEWKIQTRTILAERMLNNVLNFADFSKKGAAVLAGCLEPTLLAMLELTDTAPAPFAETLYNNLLRLRDLASGEVGPGWRHSPTWC